MNIRRNSALAVIVATILAMMTSPAYAYLDPGTASMVLQVLLGGLVGALVVGKLYWHKLKSFFLRQRTEAAAGDDEKPDE